MNFRDVLAKAKANNEEAIAQLLEMYRPLLIKGSVINGIFDEDLYQEQCITLLRCIKQFRVQKFGPAPIMEPVQELSVIAKRTLAIFSPFGPEKQAFQVFFWLPVVIEARKKIITRKVEFGYLASSFAFPSTFLSKGLLQAHIHNENGGENAAMALAF